MVADGKVNRQYFDNPHHLGRCHPGKLDVLAFRCCKYLKKEDGGINNPHS